MSKSISSQFTPSNRMELPVFLVPSVFVATWRSRGMNIICHPCCQSSSLACPNNPPMAIVKRAMCQAKCQIFHHHTGSQPRTVSGADHGHPSCLSCHSMVTKPMLTENYDSAPSLCQDVVHLVACILTI